MSDDEEDVFEVDTREETGESPDVSSPDTLRILEALLFASDELLTVSRIKGILPGNPDARQIRKMVDKINVQLQKERHPFEIVEIGGGYQFRTVAFYHTWVRQIFKEKQSKKLSLSALECLAIIAYKQPLSKAEIEAIRGVVSDGAMKTLLEKNLIAITGRSEKPGRPLLYGTSNEFLKYFGLNKLADLPRIEEFEAIAREKMEELSLEELATKESGETTEDTIEQQYVETSVAPEQVESLPEPDLLETTTIAAPEPTAVFEIDLDNEHDNETTDDQDEQHESTGDDEVVFDFDTIEKPEDTVLESIAFLKRDTSKDPPDEPTDTIDLDMSFDTEDIEPVEFGQLEEAIAEKTDTDETRDTDTDLFEPTPDDNTEGDKQKSDDQDDAEFLPK
ncbi:MAG: SMC-Scp complex subunit ScpB [Fibrobacterota bacterium]|nr:SMC-Scp complex subunit ScpB [Chitinispirillaceae bacterium]